jgi:uncharacterized protein involved in tolerance to divalent cations
MSDPVVVLVTCGSEEEALKIANALVEDHLAACVNLVAPIRSVYRWEGKIWDGKGMAVDHQDTKASVRRAGEKSEVPSLLFRS